MEKREIEKKIDGRRWYEKVPNSYVLLFIIIAFVGILTYIIPAGTFDREMINGRMGVIPNTFHYIDQTPIKFFDVFKAIPIGLRSSADVLFIVFMAGAFFQVVRATGALESGIAIVLKKFKDKPNATTLMIWVTTFIFGIMGAVVGFENNIAFIPIGVIVALGLGLDLMVAAALVLGGVAVGFATSPINPYTVGVAHSIAELPIFSGLALRLLYCILSLAILSEQTSRYAKRIIKDPEKSIVRGISTEGLGFTDDINSYTLTVTHKIVLSIIAGIVVFMVIGVTKWKWYLTELSAIFILGAILVGIVARFKSSVLVENMIKGASALTGGALIIGVARGIQVLLEMGNIGDTIIYSLAEPLKAFTPIVSALLMALVHAMINFFIPSGSGQAMATMPIMIPLSDLLGISRQVATLAFQIGDGIMNLIVPTLGGMMAMIAMARVPYDRWLRFAVPLVIKLTLLGWAFTIFGVLTNWGPF